MTPERRQEIEDRWATIDSELVDLAEAKVLAGIDDPAKHEDQLLDEQESLEFELGQAYFEERDELS